MSTKSRAAYRAQYRNQLPEEKLKIIKEKDRIHKSNVRSKMTEEERTKMNQENAARNKAKRAALKQQKMALKQHKLKNKNLAGAGLVVAVAEEEDENESNTEDEIQLPETSTCQTKVDDLMENLNLFAGAGASIVFKNDQEWVNTGTKDIMVFRPTIEEFQDFSVFVESIEKQNAHMASGICKIIPPKEWNPRPSKSNYYDVNKRFIYKPQIERYEQKRESYIAEFTQYKTKITVSDFQKLASSEQYSLSNKNLTLPELESHFWKILCKSEAIYGSNTPGTLFDRSVKSFNLNKLLTIMDLLKDNKLRIPGVNTCYLYFGMFKSTFAWHTEDVDLYSINYLHYGEPKFWYSIAPESIEKFEKLAAEQFSEDAKDCKAFLRHKCYMISPELLRKNGILYGTMVQYPNEFIITFPKGYHMGFNTGYNCAEAINFALERWIEYGVNAVLCKHCMVQIDMKPFLDKYRSKNNVSGAGFNKRKRKVSEDEI